MTDIYFTLELNGAVSAESYWQEDTKTQIQILSNPNIIGDYSTVIQIFPFQENVKNFLNKFCSEEIEELELNKIYHFFIQGICREKTVQIGSKQVVTKVIEKTLCHVVERQEYDNPT